MRDTSDKIKKIVLGNPTIFQTDPTYHLASLNKAPAMAATIWEIKKALNFGITPERVKMASSLVYLMKGSDGKPLAIYKIVGSGISEPGKELAAYLLDHKNFAMVPPVVFARFNHPVFGGEVFGSCHMFVGEGSEVHMQQGELRSQISSSSVRRVAAFDIRILNGDRHFGNVIYSKNQIFPIDHTLILPSFMSRIHVHFDWLNWEGAKTPFSSIEKEYIAALDPLADGKILTREVGLSQSAADMYYVSTTLLKLGVAKGMSASAIGKLIAGEPFKPQKGEKTVAPFCLALANVDRDDFHKSVENEMRKLCV